MAKEKFFEPITQQELKRLLHYTPETGEFFWKVDIKRVHAGDIAGSGTKTGYTDIRIAQRTYKAHRLAWLYVNGQFPDYLIDHINNDGKDNRITNLREADRAENGWNARKKRNNTSGTTGVYTDKRYGTWLAEIFVRGKKHRLGTFNTKISAIAARKSAEIKHFGVFAKDGN